MKNSFEGKNLKNFFIISFFSLIAFILFLLIFELVLRTTHIFGARCSVSQPDELIATRFTPNSVLWFFKENDHPIEHRINNFGWKDKHWEIEKAENIYRIAVCGDSFVEAFQVEIENSFLYLTENMLNHNSQKHVELMNFGRSGFTQTEELIVLKNDILNFNPDMFILFFLPSNDIKDIRRETTHSEHRPFYLMSGNGELRLDTSFSQSSRFKQRKFINSIKQKSALVSLITERYNLWLRAKSKKDDKSNFYRINDNFIKGTLSLYTKNPDNQFVKSYQLCKLVISKMIDVCKKNNIEFMLVCLDSHGGYIPEDEAKFKKYDNSFDAFYFEKDLRNFSDSLNVQYLGLQTPFRESYKSNNKVLHWGHWNYEGHKIVSIQLTKKLESILNQKR